MTSRFVSEGVLYLKQTLVADNELTEVRLEKVKPETDQSLEPESDE